jgi:hypothetical protein
MTARQLNLLFAAVFLLVGILATANTIRLNNYIRETVPRDVAQERCNTATIEVLKTWVTARSNRDDAMDARDDAAIVVLEKAIAGEKATPEELKAWRDAVAQDREVRAKAGEQLVPLPKC